MFVIKSNITLSDKFRKKPISGDCYRPLLFFSNEIIRSGLIVIPESGKLEMDQSYEDIVIKVYFYKDLELEKEFFVGRTFIMAEGGKTVIGKGIITEVIGEEADINIKKA